MTSGRIFGPSDPQGQHLYGGVSNSHSIVYSLRASIKTTEHLRPYCPTEQRPDYYRFAVL